MDAQKTLSVVTEKDLAQQIASNLTKEQITKKQLDSDESKQIFNINLANCYRVWQAFEKFVDDQVVNKGRLVDTQLAGLFLKLPA